MFWLAGRPVRAVVSCDLAVDRQHRALAPALALVRGIRAEVAARFDLLYGFPNAKAEGVLKRAGFREVGRARRWARVLRFSSYVERLNDGPGRIPRFARSAPRLARLGAAVVDHARGGMSWLERARLSRRYEIRTQRAPDARWNDLWASARQEYDLVGDRTAAYLRWRFANAPDTFFVTIQRRGQTALAAYAALELDRETGAAHVRDLFGHRADLDAMIDALVPAAWRAGAASISVRFLGAPAVERHLAARGFVPREGTRSIVVDQGPAVAEHAAILGDAARWHLFDADEES